MKPPSTRCPGRFCFHWRSEGVACAPGLRRSLADALQDVERIERGTCGYAFGRCTRASGPGGDSDAYEPHEPELEQHGLPWFYFVTGPLSIAEALREAYVRESEALWGRRHWMG